MAKKLGAKVQATVTGKRELAEWANRVSCDTPGRLHHCPYMTEINGDYGYCSCCESCANECLMNV